MDRAVTALQQGDMVAARSRLETLARENPTHAEALRLLGKLDLHQGQPALAAERLCQAAALMPLSAETAFEAGVALLAGQRADDAVACFQSALALQPDHAGASFNLAWALRRLGRLNEAAPHLERLVGRQPDHVDAWFNLGNLYLDQGQADDAITAFAAVLRLAPTHWQAAVNQAAALRLTGACAQAEAILRPFAVTSVDAANSLGTLLTAQGRVVEALVAFDTALARHPDHPVLACNRALAVLSHSPRQAVADFLTLTARHPESAEAWNGLGSAHLARDDYVRAEPAFARAVALAPSYADALGNLGKVQALLGRPDDALANMRQAIEAAPDRPEIQSNLLFLLRHMDGQEPEQVFAAHRAFGQRLEAAIQLLPVPAPPLTESLRRLRIGYVSPDFREHAVSLFFLPVLDGHDHSQVEVFCYHASTHDDAITAKLRQRADHWRPIAHLSASAAARLIRDDAIDILVDLAGHTAGNRLAVFAHKPAPIQATWLGYPGTTGLSRIDYRLTDGGTDGDNQRFHSERLEYLPVAACFRPPPDSPPVSPPALTRHGRIRFGAFNKLGKATPAAFRAWSAILHRLPTTELVMIVPGGDSEDVRQRLADSFAIHGIATHRLCIFGLMGLGEFLSTVGEVDVALDTFPYGGGTTSLLTLWMGVPLVCMDGNDAVSATGPSLLREIGLGDLVATDEAAYVEAAIAATDPSRLRHWRDTLRADLAASSALRETEFVTALEKTYRHWWWRHVALANAGTTTGDAMRRDETPGSRLMLGGQAQPQDGPIPLIDRLGHPLVPRGGVRWLPAPGAGLEVQADSFLEAPLCRGDILGGGDFVVECRVMLTEGALEPGTGGIMLVGQHSYDGSGWGLLLNGNADAYGWLSPNGTAGTDPDLVWTGTTTGKIIPGRWHHLALIRQGEKLRIALDGDGPSTRCPAAIRPYAEAPPLTIGGNPTGLLARAPIGLDDIRITTAPSAKVPP